MLYHYYCYCLLNIYEWEKYTYFMSLSGIKCYTRCRYLVLYTFTWYS